VTSDPGESPYVAAGRSQASEESVTKTVEHEWPNLGEPQRFCVLLLKAGTARPLYECPMFTAQMPGPPRGIVSGKVQSVSNGTLTIISDKPSYSVPQGSKVDFVLTAETMIFNPHARAGVSDKQKRHLFPEVTCLNRRFSS
jgi:hypothetical protein